MTRFEDPDLASTLCLVLITRQSASLGFCGSVSNSHSSVVNMESNSKHLAVYAGIPITFM